MCQHSRVGRLRCVSRGKVLRWCTCCIDLLHWEMPSLMLRHVRTLILLVSRWTRSLVVGLVLLISWRACSMTRNRRMANFALVLVWTMYHGDIPTMVILRWPTRSLYRLMVILTIPTIGCARQWCSWIDWRTVAIVGCHLHLPTIFIAWRRRLHTTIAPLYVTAHASTAESMR